MCIYHCYPLPLLLRGNWTILPLQSLACQAWVQLCPHQTCTIVSSTDSSVSMCSSVCVSYRTVLCNTPGLLRGVDSRKEGTLPHDTRRCRETHPGQHPGSWEQRQSRVHGQPEPGMTALIVWTTRQMIVIRGRA